MIRLDWLLSPVAFYSGAALSLVTSTALFVSIKLEMARSRAQAEVSNEVSNTVHESEALVVRSLQAEVEKLRETVSQLEADRPVRSTGEGINLTRRAQALRMHRRGESVPSIAATLETPSNEVELLLKVQGLTNKAPVGSAVSS